MRLLIVEDEKNILDALKFSFQKEGFLVDSADNGLDGLDLCYGEIYDVIILDRMLPKMEGIEILKKIRKDKIQTPVLILSAKDTVIDRSYGLDCGADDYLIKPFATKELISRVKALARRGTVPIIDDIIKISDIEFVASKCEIVNINTNKIVNLTFKESQIFELLAMNKNNTITRENIYEKNMGIR